MRTSPTETDPQRAATVRVARDSLVVDLTDGRTLTVPLTWHPRLEHGTADERDHWRPIGAGTGIHWPDLDEDICIDDLIAALPSNESPSSFKKWLASRPKEPPNRRMQPTPHKPRRG